jgi:hypothetical protein
LWRILDRAGHATTVVGWPAAGPGAELLPDGLPESFFAHPDLPSPAAALAAGARELRPSLESVDPTVFAPLGDEVPAPVRNAVVGDLWREAVARRLLPEPEDEVPHVLFLGLPGLLEVSRGSFGGYSAVQFDGASRTEQLVAAQLVGGYYAVVDRMLARLWRDLPEPRLLAIVAAHGVREPRRIRRLLSSVSSPVGIAGRVDGDADGVLMLLGDNLSSGVVLDRVEIVDVAPTLLYAMGQPVPRDSDGNVLTAAFGSAFLTRNPLTFVPTYAALAEASAESTPAP